jgi:hypothetical protein
MFCRAFGNPVGLGVLGIIGSIGRAATLFWRLEHGKGSPRRFARGGEAHIKARAFILIVALERDDAIPSRELHSRSEVVVDVHELAGRAGDHRCKGSFSNIVLAVEDPEQMRAPQRCMENPLKKRRLRSQ